MKEIEQSVGNTFESTHIVEVPSDVDFVYIMRKDSAYVAATLSTSLARDYGLHMNQVQQIVYEEYEQFTHRLGRALSVAFSPKGETEIHVFAAEPLEQAEFRKAGPLPIVSLDPLLEHGVTSFCVSRGFFQGGVKDFGQMNRPGSESLAIQAHVIAAKFGNCPVCVVEDDIFSGGSVMSALEHLQNAGVTIAKLIPGIQIGRPTKIETMGIPVDPVVTYKTIDHVDIFSKVDLGDPRDYLFGASGLVVALSDGTFCRVPYLLPFVSTSARASVRKETEVPLALNLYQLNQDFFKSVEQAIGKPVLLKHMDHSFIRFMEVEYGFSQEIPMIALVDWASRQLKTDAVETGYTPIPVEQMEALHLPQKLIFLDVDGTIIRDDAVDGTIDQDALHHFQNIVAQLSQHGIVVGLNSDSPLPQLQCFAERLGLIDAPIIAENGNLIWYHNQKVILSSLVDKESFKETIASLAASKGLRQVADCINPTFGGRPVHFEAGEWAFGANRETSVSVFGPADFIDHLGKVLPIKHGISFDCSPEYNYCALHPGIYQENKGLMLQTVSNLGHTVVMIGNSTSDWVKPTTGVKCAFVGGSRIPSDIAVQSMYLSTLPIIQGVTDILEHVNL